MFMWHHKRVQALNRRCEEKLVSPRRPVSIPLLLLLAFSLQPTACSILLADTHYVDINCATPVSPYTQWSTAARVIQDAVNVASAGDTVLVTNGVYSTGGRPQYGAMTNRVAITNAITVRSVNGPQYSLIVGKGPVGAGAVRCAYVTNNAVLSGFTLTNGATLASSDLARGQGGGGVYCENGGVLTNCVLTCNAAGYYGGGSYKGILLGCVLSTNVAYYGGGAYMGALTNCLIKGNCASGYAGGVYDGLSSGCVVTGNVASSSGGGVYGGMLVNSVLSANVSGGSGGGATEAILTNCNLYGNSGTLGGGVSGGKIMCCLLSGNTASSSGGGAYQGALTECILSNNTAINFGGGAKSSALTNCVILKNSATYGGGVDSGTLKNCTLQNNAASSSGGGSYNGKLISCYFNGNTALSGGGGSQYGVLFNCTLSGNVAQGRGGGTYYSDTTNCIIYYNSSPSDSNYYYGKHGHCCTQPRPAGVGNITNEPILVSSSHISELSLCVGAGVNIPGDGTDFDGEVWRIPPSIGCDEPYSVSAIGPLSVAMSAVATSTVENLALTFAAQIEGRVTSNIWTFGDGSVVVNQLSVLHAWGALGTYPVVLTAFNSSYSTGISCTTFVYVVEQMYYVNVSNAAPVKPYTSWATAATNIQEAISAPGWPSRRTVWVMDGVYDSGQTVVAYNGTNRVALTNSVSLRSVNGPKHTVIKGKKSSESRGIRCAYVAAGCLLEGFTLTDGDASSEYGGAAQGAGVISNCWIYGNRATLGGGVYGCDINNCRVYGNKADNSGGGVYSSTMRNSVLADNEASSGGGGAADGQLFNCTVTGNSAWSGGGSLRGTLNNCIVYYNYAAVSNNYSGGVLRYCCTTPEPPGNGTNVTSEPCLVSAMHIAANSPCVGKANPVYASGVDLDGEGWQSTPSIGCDEPSSDLCVGDIAVSIESPFREFAANFSVLFTAWIEGRVSQSEWNFGDGVVLSNRAYASHSWGSTGLYAVVLTAWNVDHPLGVACTAVVSVVEQPVNYVNISNTMPAYPYATWATAATNIQDAVSAAGPAGHRLVLVADGVYAAGGGVVCGTITNRVVLTNNVTLRSVNGPQSTSIKGKGPNGSGAIRCVYVGVGCCIEGFALFNGATLLNNDWTQSAGGGVWHDTGGVVSNCWMIGNSACVGGGAFGYGTLINCVISRNTAVDGGGGSSRGVLRNCLLIDNVVSDNYTGAGGGALGGRLENCTLSANTARDGGGVYGGELNSCIVQLNSGPLGVHNHSYSKMNYCCTDPLPTSGANNITSNAWFSSGYQLHVKSPCINRGVNQEWMAGAVDLDGRPRVLNGIVDMGAYEFQFSIAPKFWLQGPYDAKKKIMSALLSTNIPVISPYMQSERFVPKTPSNVVDWVLLELQDTNRSTQASASGFLDKHGRVINVDGNAGIPVSVPAGDYYFVIRHRNHLSAISSIPVSFTNSMVSYDFTTGSDKYMGGTNACVELEPGVWGLIGGDADGDGRITPVDREIVERQKGMAGYLQGDLNLDGKVDGED
jgi:parallel beta-helix repeat protein